MLDLVESLTQCVERTAAEKEQGNHFSDGLCRSVINIADTIINENTATMDQKKRCKKSIEILST